MKKILLIVALVLVGFSAKAWNSQQDEGVVLLATKYLTPRAKLVLENFLGASYSDDIGYIAKLDKQKKSPYSKDVHYLHLDTNLQPMAVEGDDAVKAIEQALTVVAGYETLPKVEITKALRTIINLMCDMHYLSKVRIQGVDYSWADFKFNVQRASSGALAKEVSPTKWSSFWNTYAAYHKGFHAALWAEDLNVCHGAQYAEFTKGGLRDWAANNGAVALTLYNANVKPDGYMTRIERLQLEDLHYEMMAKAGLRLAALFNNALK